MHMLKRLVQVCIRDLPFSLTFFLSVRIREVFCRYLFRILIWNNSPSISFGGEHGDGAPRSAPSAFLHRGVSVFEKLIFLRSASTSATEVFSGELLQKTFIRGANLATGPRVGEASQKYMIHMPRTVVFSDISNYIETYLPHSDRKKKTLEVQSCSKWLFQDDS